MMLHAFMDPEARARLTRVKLVKPQKAAQVEAYVLQMGKSGRLQSKVSEQMLIDMLEQLSEKDATSQPKVTIQRRRNVLEED